MTIQSKPVHTIHDLISLKLIVRDKKLSKISYNLDDLRDLESKLVLITGSKAENRTEVDHYLNVCIIKPCMHASTRGKVINVSVCCCQEITRSLHLGLRYEILLFLPHSFPGSAVCDQDC